MSFTSLRKHIDSEAQMAAFAGQLAEIAQVGDVLLLDGDLGVGKSFFSRSFINHLAQKQLGRKIEVPSPTFTLVQTYDQLKPAIWHFDLYRLSSSDEAYELGLDEAVKTSICLIEWPSRLEGDLPENCLNIFFEHDGLESRKVKLLLNSDWAERLKHLF
ncbi:MAG: tRNA (adenosine(37)-N6)-threonylcarbamoyltransferase complex ATPase subunit type 1 TsaE [Alphaproteobacteria bacterium]|nr:tRNA (adenosine(37)-N6)-threonylcarbamoyltransferase complex ATPase subunit type 1 TsaE [Alphaproteobacteria bacterium]